MEFKFQLLQIFLFGVYFVLGWLDGLASSEKYIRIKPMKNKHNNVDTKKKKNSPPCAKATYNYTIHIYSQQARARFFFAKSHAMKTFGHITTSFSFLSEADNVFQMAASMHCDLFCCTYSVFVVFYDISFMCVFGNGKHTNTDSSFP